MTGKRVSKKNTKVKSTPKSSAGKGGTNQDKMKRLTFDISVSSHTQLKVASAKSGQTMGEIVRGCIDKYLEGKG